MLIEVFYYREVVIIQDFLELGRISNKVIPLATINIIPYQVQQVKQFSILRKLQDTIINIVQKRINRGVLKLYKSQYQNLYFLVAKKDNSYRLINNTQRINKVIIRDTNLLLNPNKLIKEFSSYYIISLTNFFSSYN